MTIIIIVDYNWQRHNDSRIGLVCWKSFQNRVQNYFNGKNPLPRHLFQVVAESRSPLETVQRRIEKEKLDLMISYS